MIVMLAKGPRGGSRPSPVSMAGIAMAAVVVFVAACSGPLPQTSDVAGSPWQSFDEAKAAYESIVLLETTAEDLKAIGYDPSTSPNVRVLSYLEVIQRFMPKDAIHVEDLDTALRSCIEAGTACWGYEVTPKLIHEERRGNVLLDVFGFKRTTVTTGWRFTAVVVLKDDLVHYKVWEGTPNIQEEKTATRPLGPLQEVDNIVTGLIAP